MRVCVLCGTSLPEGMRHGSKYCPHGRCKTRAYRLRKQTEPKGPVVSESKAEPTCQLHNREIPPITPTNQRRRRISITLWPAAVVNSSMFKSRFPSAARVSVRKGWPILDNRNISIGFSADGQTVSQVLAVRMQAALHRGIGVSDLDRIALNSLQTVKRLLLAGFSEAPKEAEYWFEKHWALLVPLAKEIARALPRESAKVSGHITALSYSATPARLVQPDPRERTDEVTGGLAAQEIQEQVNRDADDSGDIDEFDKYGENEKGADAEDGIDIDANQDNQGEITEDEEDRDLANGSGDWLRDENEEEED